MDDILISSSSFTDHLQNLNTTFATLRANSLMVNPSKTCTSYTELEFLGHTISSKGVRISDSKTKAIQKITPPETKKALQRLLGLIQYFRRRIPNFSARTYHMRQLLKQDLKFQWTEQCDNELQNLKKNALTNASIMAPFKFYRKVYIDTDGSLFGLGACCLQMNNQNQPQVCSYMSVSLTDSQKNWHSYQLEMYAIAMALKQNKTFFLQSDIKIFTDNAVCVSIEKYNPLNAREKRLLAYISQFRIKMQYVQSKINRVADALSRLPADIKTSEIHAYEPLKNLKDEEFILAATELIENPNTDELITDCKEEAIVWTAYRINYESGENKQEKLHDSNLNGKIFVPFNLDGHKITAPVTPQDDQEQQNPQRTIALPKRSDRIASRSARSLQQQAAQDQNASSDQNNVAMPSTSNELGDLVGDCITNDNANLQQTPNSSNQIDDFEQWSQDMQSNPVEVNYDELTNEIAEIVDKPKITINDYLADTYFAAIYLYVNNDELPADDEKARKYF